MDFQAVQSPQNYGAPNVFQGQQGGQAQGQPGQQPQQGQQQNQIVAVLQKAKQLLSSGQISPDQYNALATQYMGGNMGAGMPGADPSAGAPLNIMPGQGG